MGYLVMMNPVFTGNILFNFEKTEILLRNHKIKILDGNIQRDFSGFGITKHKNSKPENIRYHFI